MKRALLIAIAIASVAFAACVRDVELSRPTPDAVVVSGPDADGTPDAQPFIPPDG